MNKYIELLVKYPPRPITSKEEEEKLLSIIDNLIDHHYPLTEEEKDYIELLGILLSHYETEFEDTTIPDIHDIALLKELMEMDGITKEDLLQVFGYGSQNTIDSILNEEIELSVNDIIKLSKLFKIPVGAFLSEVKF